MVTEKNYLVISVYHLNVHNFYDVLFLSLREKANNLTKSTLNADSLKLFAYLLDYRYAHYPLTNQSVNDFNDIIQLSGKSVAQVSDV